MDRVPGDDGRKGANREPMVRCDAATLPGVGRKMLKERQRGAADGAKFLEKAGPCPSVGAGMMCGDGLLEAGQRRVESAREPEGTKRKHSFGVVHVTDDLANTPGSGRMAKPRMFVTDPAQPIGNLDPLRLEDGANV